MVGGFALGDERSLQREQSRRELAYLACLSFPYRVWLPGCMRGDNSVQVMLCEMPALSSLAAGSVLKQLAVLLD